MGSRFEDLNVTNPFPKTDRDFQTRFERYLFFRVQLQRENQKLVQHAWDGLAG